MRRSILSAPLLTCVVKLVSGCQHPLHQSYGFRPEPPNAPQGPGGEGLPEVGAFADPSEELDPSLHRSAVVHVTSLGAYAGQGEGTVFSDGAGWLDLTLFSTMPGTYTLRLAPSCLGQVNGPAMCTAAGEGFVSQVEVDDQGDATLRAQLPGSPASLAGQGLVLYRMVTDATEMPGQPSCVGTACGLIEPVAAELSH